jgi:hypothetical protein
MARRRAEELALLRDGTARPEQVTALIVRR